MKKAWIYIVLIFLAIWAYDAWVCHALRNAPFGEFRKLTHVFEEEMDEDVLIIGSSRAELNFNPDLLQLGGDHKLYNTGLVGTNLVVTKTMLKQRLELNHTIHTVILVTDFLLWSDPDIENFTDGPRFLPYLRNSVVYENLAAAHPKVHAIKWFPPYSATYWNDRYLYNATRGIQNKPIKVDEGTNIETGYRILPEEHATEFHTAVESVDTWVSESELDALDEIYATCQANNIRIVTIVPPVYGNKLQELGNDEAWKAMKNRSETNASQLIDYSKWRFDQDSTLFFDDIHLNPKGVKLFMEDFQKDLDELF